MEKITADEFIKLTKTDLKGKIFCFPTDTVYGVGALYDDKTAIAKIYRMKKRSLEKPLANLCSNINQIIKQGIYISLEVQKIIDKYWPGALTIIFPKQDKKLAFRMPNSSVALKIIDRFSILAVTSVNESGEKELNSYEEINDAFGNIIDYYICDEVSLSKIASTVIDVSANEIKVLRKGSIII